MEWNKLDNEVVKHSVSVAQLLSQLRCVAQLRCSVAIRPVGNSIYNIHDILGVRYLTELRFQFSALNKHKFRHNFDCLSPVCVCGTAKENNEHFLLHCRCTT